jgi:hypothetical protein
MRKYIDDHQTSEDERREEDLAARANILANPPRVLMTAYIELQEERDRRRKERAKEKEGDIISLPKASHDDGEADDSSDDPGRNFELLP